LDVNGDARIRTIANLGSTATRFLVASATGVVSERTAAELASDIGATNFWTQSGSGVTDRIYRDGKVIIGTTSDIRSTLGILQESSQDVINAQWASGDSALRVGSSNGTVEDIEFMARANPGIKFNHYPTISTAEISIFPFTRRRTDAAISTGFGYNLNFNAQGSDLVNRRLATLSMFYSSTNGGYLTLSQGSSTDLRNILRTEVGGAMSFGERAAFNLEFARFRPYNGSTTMIAHFISTSGTTDYALQVNNDRSCRAFEIYTADFTGSTSRKWKLGERKAATTTLDTTQYITVQVNGTVYNLALVTI
jgi:hypothetical protein